jgi:thiol:disulfide interchange protein DsbD
MRAWRQCFGLLFNLLWIGTALLWMQPAGAGQSSTVQADHLAVQLISQDAQAAPGTTTVVGVRLEHEPHWHTYWINPGDSGLGTRLTWELPAGLSAAEIDWPAPQRIPVGPLTNFGYDGEMVLPVRITLPATLEAGSSVPLRVKVSWLVCQEECIPGDAVLELLLPIAARSAPDPKWAALFAAARKAQPEAVAWRAWWQTAGDDVDVLIQDRGALGAAADVEIFPQAGTLIAHGRGTAQRIDAATLRIRTPRSDSFAAASTSTPFLLAAGTGTQRRVVRLDVAPATAAAAPAALPSTGARPTVLLALAFALLGGVLLNLMPCVLPVLALKALALAEHTHDQPGTRVQGLSYCAGTLLSFLALAGLLLALRAAGQELGWGFQLQTPWVVAGLAMLMALMGLSLSGMFELGASWMGLGQGLTERSGARGAFFSGVLAAVVASPCTAPFMGPALGFAIVQPAPVALGVFAALALGLSLPIVVLSFAPGLGRWLPRPGPWMVRFKQVMAYPLYLTAVWLLWVLGRQSGADGMALVLLGMVALVFGLWLWGTSPASAQIGARTVMRAGALLAIVGAGACLLALQRLPAAASTGTDASWRPWSAADLQALRAAGKPVLVNMTAAWCITCLANERVALSSQSVQQQLRDLGIVYLKGDWTQRDAAITSYLSQFERNGVPLYVVYPSGAGAPEVLPQMLTPAMVIAALQRAAAGSHSSAQTR